MTKVASPPPAAPIKHNRSLHDPHTVSWGAWSHLLSIGGDSMTREMVTYSKRGQANISRPSVLKWRELNEAILLPLLRIMGGINDGPRQKRPSAAEARVSNCGAILHRDYSYTRLDILSLGESARYIASQTFAENAKDLDRSARCSGLSRLIQGWDRIHGRNRQYFMLYEGPSPLSPHGRAQLPAIVSSTAVVEGWMLLSDPSFPC